MSQAEGGALPAPKPAAALAEAPVIETAAGETVIIELKPIPAQAETEVDPAFAAAYNAEPASSHQVAFVREVVEKIRAFGNDKASVEGVEKKAGKKLKAMTKGEINEISERLVVVLEGLAAERQAKGAA